MAKVKGKGRRQKLIINDKSASSEEESKGEKPCKHINKATKPQSLRNVLPHLKNGECKDCRGKPKIAPELKDTEDAELAESVCICLKCGYQGCSRNSTSQHAHTHFQHQSNHTICINTTSWVVWCYACDKELDVSDDNNQLQKAVKMIREKRTKGSKENGDEKSCMTGTVKGLRNLGNTCFFNSVLQNISQSAMLIDKLDSLFQDEREIKLQSDQVDLTIKKTASIGPLTAALKSFFDEFHSSSRGVVVPSKLFGEITKKSPQFGGYRQQDSQELLRYLLDGMRMEELKRIEAAMKDAVKKLENPPTKEQLKDCFKNAKTFVDDVFGGKLVSTIICFECKSKSQVYDSFFDLSLPVNTTPKESAKSAAARLLNGMKKNEDKNHSGSEDENQKNLSKHKRKVLAKKEKKAKRGKGKPFSRQKRKDSNVSSDKQNSDIEQDGDEYDDDDKPSSERNQSTHQQEKSDELLKGKQLGKDGENPIAELTESLKNFTVKDEEDFVIIEKNANSHPESKEPNSWEGKNHAILGGSMSKSGATESSSMEGLGSKDGIVCRGNASSNDDHVETVVMEGEKMEEIKEQNGSAVKSGHSTVEESEMERKTELADWECADDIDDKEAKRKREDLLIEKTIMSIYEQRFKLKCESTQQVIERIKKVNSGKTEEEMIGKQEKEMKNETSSDSGNLMNEFEKPEGDNKESKESTEEDCEGNRVGKQQNNENNETEEKEILKVISEKNQSNLDVEMKEKKEGEAIEGNVDGEDSQAKDHGDEEDSQAKDHGDESVLEEGDTDENSDQEMENGYVETVSQEYKCRPGECSVLSCLHQFTSKDVLEGNNKFNCEECTKRRNEVKPGKGNKPDTLKPVYTVATKQMLLWEPPSVLTLHLKRFEQVGRGLRKVNKHIEFPLNLDLSPFCHQSKWVSKENLQYNLYGIVEHSGSLHSGHYVACVKTRTIDNKFKWYYISDSRVSEIQEEAVLRRQAYVLFYHQESRRQDKLNENK